MTYLIASILIFINYISSLIKKSNKITRNLLLILMWILFWGNYSSADYSNYILLYNHVLQTGKGFVTSELGFSLLIKFVSKFGLEYYQFLMLISFIGLCLIVSTIKRYTNKPQLVYVLYFIYPFLLDVVQVRHFVAMSIVIFCFRYLENEDKINTIKFILGIIIAFTIHYISIIFLPLIIIKRVSIKKLYKFIFFVLILGIPLAYTDLFQIMASYLVPIQKTEGYFLNRARFGFLVEWFMQSMIFLVIYYSRKYLLKNNYSNNFVELIYKTNIYLIVLFPLYIINGTFQRAFRMVMILNYIIFSMVLKKTNKNKKVLLLFWSLLFMIILLAHYIIIPSKYTVFLPIFENNLFFD